MKMLILMLVLMTAGCTVKIVSGDQLTQKAKACIDAGMDIRVLVASKEWGEQADIVCVQKGAK